MNKFGDSITSLSNHLLEIEAAMESCKKTMVEYAKHIEDTKTRLAKLKAKHQNYKEAMEVLTAKGEENVQSLGQTDGTATET